MSDRTTVRDPFFDIVKFVAMFLVVVHHCVSRGVIACPPYIKNFTVGMNMPLFFILTGYFARNTIITCNWKKLLAHVKGYLLPLAMLAIVVTCVVSVVKHKSAIEVVIYAKNSFLLGAWYLWTITYMYVGTFFAMFSGRNEKRAVVIALALYFSLFFLGDITYVPQARAMYPYFLLGVFLFPKHRIWECTWWGGGLLLTFLIVVFVEGNVYRNGLSWYDMPTTMNALCSSRSAVPLFLARLLIGLMGSVGVMWGLYALVNHFKIFGFLAQFGTETLGVYILHERFLNIIKSAVFPISLWMLLPFSAVIFLLCHYFYKVVKPFFTCSIMGGWKQVRST